MTPTSAELVHGVCDQCQRFLSSTSAGIGDAEGCGDLRYPVNELPGATEMETPL
jgi:hypothetical protein